MSNGGEGSFQAFDFKLWAEALKGDLTRIVDQRLERLEERVD